MIRWIIFVVSVPIGCLLGAVLGWFCVALPLHAMNRDGHGSIELVFSAAALGAALGTFLFPLAIYLRFVRR